MNAALAARFEALWRRVNPRANSVEFFARLAAAYGAQERAYHNAAHIAHMLEEFDAARNVEGDADAVELAIWFHDAVYDSRARDNEERSAALADAALADAGAAAKQRAAVAALILATKHQHPPRSADEKLLIDCDLAILGQPRERFDAYEAAIRCEYDWVESGAYRAGRAAVLKQFLARATIYSLPWFCARYEDAARKNLAHSLMTLGVD